MRQGQVDGGSRHDRIKRHIIIVRGQRQHVGADFISHVTVGGGAIGADEAFLGLPGFQEMASHIIRNNIVRDAILF